MSPLARHGDLDYPVLGETNETSGELVWAIKKDSA